MRAVQITEFGGPEVLEVVDMPAPEAGEGELLVDVSTAGVNYADTHQIDDDYLSRTTLPFVPGGEVVGTTADGRRVAAMIQGGGYAEQAVVPRRVAVDVPDAVDDQAAVAMLVQGLTAYNLLTLSTRLQEGDTVVIHAAAGGVGSLLVQLARMRGAGRIVGLASTDEKRALVEQLGADVAIDSRSVDIRSAIEEASEGKPDVIIDMVGGRVTNQSLAALAPLGRYAYYGQASRQNPDPVHLGSLMARSKTVAGFWLMDCMRRPAELVRAPLAELLGLVAAGELRVVGESRYPLGEARRCHEDLRARRTTGKVTLDCTT